MTAQALEVMATPMAPYLNLMQEMSLEQKLALVAFLINTIQNENCKKMMKRSKHTEIWFSHKKYVPLQSDKRIK